MTFSLVSDKKEGVEVVEELVGAVLRWSSVEIRQGCGGFGEKM